MVLVHYCLSYCRLEEIASELSLNLVKIIVHCCCRLIPSMSVKSEVAGNCYVYSVGVIFI
jgi:hypothetical protein